jgi:hypothetical protein
VRRQTVRVAAPGEVLPEMRAGLESLVAGAAAQVDLCSPFLSGGTALWLAAAAAASPAEWTLLTRLDAVSAAGGYLSVPGLRALRDAGVRLFHGDRLHAKVFLADGSSGLLGSGNLTASGLGEPTRSNLELGVVLDAAQAAVADGVLSGWRATARPTTTSMLDECEKQAKGLRVPAPRLPGGGSADDVEAVLAEGLAAKQVWIKALYADAAEADRPWSPGDWIASPAVRRPSFAVGDLLLVYASYARVCNAVIRVVAPTPLDPAFAVAQGTPQDEADRWPWITPVEPVLQVPAADGVPLQRLGLTGQSLQNGHTRMPVGGLAAALRHMRP